MTVVVSMFQAFLLLSEDCSFANSLHLTHSFISNAFRIPISIYVQMGILDLLALAIRGLREFESILKSICSDSFIRFSALHWGIALFQFLKPILSKDKRSATGSITTDI